MSVSVFEHKPEKRPYGHVLWPGKVQVSWMPCICAPAREASGRGRGMGHVTVICNACHEERRESKFFEPAHDSGQRPLTGWSTRLKTLTRRRRRLRPLRRRGRR